MLGLEVRITANAVRIDPPEGVQPFGARRGASGWVRTGKADGPAIEPGSELHDALVALECAAVDAADALATAGLHHQPTDHSAVIEEPS